MPITLPGFVAANEVIEAAWGNAVVSALDELDDEKVDLNGDTLTGPLLLASPQSGNVAAATRKDYVDGKFVEIDGDTMTGLLIINPTSGPEALRFRGAESVLDWYDEAGTNRLAYINSTTTLTKLAADNGDLRLIVGAVTQIHCDVNNVLFGKIAADANNDGVEIFSGSSTAAGRIQSTCSTEDSYSNLICRHLSAMDAADEYFIQFQRTTSGTIAGSVTQGAGSTVNFNTTSDYRTKNDLGPVVSAVDRVNQLHPRRVAFKEATDYQADSLYAHDVAAVVPAAVTGEKDAVYAEDIPIAGIKQGDPILQQLDYSKLVPLLVAAIQEQSAEIAELRAQIGVK